MNPLNNSIHCVWETVLERLRVTIVNPPLKQRTLAGVQETPPEIFKFTEASFPIECRARDTESVSKQQYLFRNASLFSDNSREVFLFWGIQFEGGIHIQAKSINSA